MLGKNASIFFKQLFILRRQKLPAFTLIELLAVTAIVLVMAIVAVPSYSKYSARADFFAKTDELKEALDQTRIFALHPEADFDHYEVDVNTANATATFKKIKLTDSDTTDPLPFTVIKTIKMPAGTVIAQTAGSPFDSGSRYYECDSPISQCCLFTAHENWKCDQNLHPSPDITNQMNDGDWLTITSDSSLGPLVRKISIKNHMIVMEDQ